MGHRKGRNISIMKRVLTFQLLLGVMAGAALMEPAASSAFAQQQAALFSPTRFDGVYSVEVDTKDGSCSTSRWTVRIREGQVASVSPNNANISALGLIESDGAVSMTFTSGQGQVAHVGGTVKGRYGKGFWSSPTLLCGGTWRAEKER